MKNIEYWFLKFTFLAEKQKRKREEKEKLQEDKKGKLNFQFKYLVKYATINAKFEELKEMGLLVPGASPQAFSEGLQEVKQFFRFNVFF